MDNSTSITFALVGIVGSVIVSLFKLLNDNTKALKRMAESTDKVAKTTEKVAQATEKGNLEAKQRNGHLGEQNVQIAQLITKQSADLTAIRESNQANSETNKRVEEILQQSTVTLAQTETDKTIATSIVKEMLASK